MKPVDFTLHQPRTVDEALALLAEHGEDAKVLAGGQSLVPLLNFRLARPEHLIDLGRITALTELHRSADELVIGAMVTQAQAERSPAVAAYAPLMSAALPNIAHPAIRNRGTIGGSLAHGDPAAELPAAARALDATFVVAGPRGRRTIAAADFFLGNLVTQLEADELLVETRISQPPARTAAAFEEVGRRRGDFALVGAGVQLNLAEDRTIAAARICLTGVAAAPHRASEAEGLLTGRALSADLLAEVADAIRSTIEPGSDLHASSDYRGGVGAELTTRVVRTAYARATNAADVAA